MAAGAAARGLWRQSRRLAIAGLLLAASAGPALAHAAERGFVLLLPTELYIAGGVAVVALSFALMALLPAAPARALDRLAWPLGRLPASLTTILSLASLGLVLALILAGRLGTQDPLENPLPLAVWTLWWLGLTVLTALVGDLWSALNPWRGLVDLACRLPWLARPPLRYPAWLGHGPALVQFLAFAWFELIYTAPQSPELLAGAVALYLALNLVAALLFGREAWLARGEAFSVFFRMVAWLSPLNGRPDETPGRPVLTVPGLGLLRLPPLPLSAAAFVLLALATVSFDGLSRTFRWLALIGVNPLDFPGRSAVMTANTLGLLGLVAVLLAGYGAAVWLGHRLAGRPGPLTESLGAYALAIVPLALGYHLAHYLTAFLVDGQYALIAFSDPFGRGWDLFRLGHVHVTTSFLNQAGPVRLIWLSQLACIVAAHVLAVALAHLIALRRLAGRREALLSQLPLTLLMVAYTLFGLWLLSTASAG